VPAQLDRLTKELLEHFPAEASSRFRENAMVGRRHIEVVTEKQAIPQMHAHLLGQAPFRSDAVEIANEHDLENDDRVDGWLTRVAVVGTTEGSDKGEVDGGSDATQQVIWGYEPVEGEVVVVELGVGILLTHHELASSSLGGQAAHIDHITDQILGRVRQQPLHDLKRLPK